MTRSAYLGLGLAGVAAVAAFLYPEKGEQKATAMTDTPPQLYAPQEPIFPGKVKGFFRTFKWWIMAVTLGIDYLTP